MKLSLLVLSQGKLEGKAIPITLSQFLIGRDPQCHLRPASPLISKRHCAVLVKGGKVFLRDFGSTNGTFVNEEPVKAERQLQNNDTLKVGPLLFRVQVEGAPATDKTTPLPPQAKKQPAPSLGASDSGPLLVDGAPPAPKPPAVEVAAGGDDESIAAMLLSLQEGDDSDSGPPALAEDIPSGTTVMDIPATGPDQPAAPASGVGLSGTNLAGKDKDKKESADGKDKAKGGTSSSAAAALLAKYARRPRT
jgi:predicted component of type VI protein secretion system